MAAFSGLENTSPRIPLVKPSEIPPVGTYETDRSTIVASGEYRRQQQQIRSVRSFHCKVTQISFFS